MAHPQQCNEMRKMREQLRTATPEGRNQIAKRISNHYKSCEQCAEWWDWMWNRDDESNVVPASSLHEVAGSSRHAHEPRSGARRS